MIQLRSYCNQQYDNNTITIRLQCEPNIIVVYRIQLHYLFVYNLLYKLRVVHNIYLHELSF
jgi:hypothetical protein